MFSVSLEGYVFFFFSYYASNLFLLRSSVVRLETTLPVVHLLRIQQAGTYDLYDDHLLFGVS